MNKDGKKVSKNYVSIQYLDKGYYAAYETNSKYEVIDKEGQVVINGYFRQKVKSLNLMELFMVF